MRNRSLWMILVAAGLFAFGLQQLFVLRFESGDVYPPYSSLRADPLGVKALYESLDHHLEAGRHYQPLLKLGGGHDTTLFVLGAKRDGLRFTEEEFTALESFLWDGGRLVFALYPSYRAPGINPFLAGRTGPGSGQEEDSHRAPTISVTERWGFEFGYVALEKDPTGIYAAQPAQLQAELALPERLSCHTSLVFTNLEPAWNIVYARRDDLPVVIERGLGKGTIVFSADSYHMSNEALVAERHSTFLSWLAGSAARVVFDETHLGVRESPGIATLVRKYRLHGLGLALSVLAGLFIWKNSVSFMPPYEAQSWRDRRAWVAGKDASAGFINLLRRNVPRPALMRVCLEQWIAHAPRRRPVPPDKLRLMQQLIDEENARPARQQDPVRLYQELARLLAKKPFPPVPAAGVRHETDPVPTEHPHYNKT